MLFLAYTALAQQSTSLSVTGTDNVKQEVKKLEGENKTVTPGEVLLLREAEFDFGKIPQGKPVTHIFYFTNTGTSSLSLENVQTSCGCTTPEWSKEAIPAGGNAKIIVGYNAMNEGMFTKFITISYNVNQTKQVTIKGEVWKTPDNSAPPNEALKTLKINK